MPLLAVAGGRGSRQRAVSEYSLSIAMFLLFFLLPPRVVLVLVDNPISVLFSFHYAGLVFLFSPAEGPGEQGGRGGPPWRLVACAE